MALATRPLLESVSSIAVVGRHVGYGSEFASFI
jgi:hypothetical protein